MTYEPWPDTGIGTWDHELGSTAPGSPRPKGATKRLLKRWYSTVELVTFGKSVESQVAFTRFAKDVKRLSAMGITDEQLAEAFKRFAHDVKVGRVKLKTGGPSLWSLFITMWPRYSEAPTNRVVRQKSQAPSSWAAIRDSKKKL